MIFKKIILNEFLGQKSGFTFRSVENSCFDNLEYFGINVRFVRHIDENISHYNRYLSIISEG